MMSKLIVLAGALALLSAKELSPENWEQETKGKTVMLRFFAPWCGHSKALEPKFAKLIAKYDGNPTVTVADVDCEGKGQALCEEQKVTGYPSVRWGSADMLEEYEGEHEEEPMMKFAEENMKPVCNPENLEPCDPDKRKVFEKYMKMNDKDLDKVIAEFEKLHKEAEDAFDDSVQEQQEHFEELEKKKAEEQEKIKESGLSMMKAVRTHLYGARPHITETKAEL